MTGLRSIDRMQYILKRAAQILLNSAFLLLITLPVYTIFDPGMSEESEERWVDCYVYNDLELAIFIIPLVLCCILIQVGKEKWNRRRNKIFAVIFSGVYFLYAIQALLISVQDFVPNYGILPLLVIFPLLLLYCYVDQNKYKEN